MDPQPGNAYAEGVRLLKARSLSDAQAHLAQAVEEDPANAQARMYLGICLAQRGESAAGIECLREAARLAPADTNVLYNLAAALVQSGQREDARPVLEELLRIDPSHAKAQSALAAFQPPPLPVPAQEAAEPPLSMTGWPGAHAGAPTPTRQQTAGARAVLLTGPVPLAGPAPQSRPAGPTPLTDPIPLAGRAGQAGLPSPAPSTSPAPHAGLETQARPTGPMPLAGPATLAGPPAPARAPGLGAPLPQAPLAMPAAAPAGMHAAAASRAMGGWRDPSASLMLGRGLGWGWVYGQVWTGWNLFWAIVWGMGSMSRLQAGSPTIAYGIIAVVFVFVFGGAGFFVGLIIGAAQLDIDQGALAGSLMGMVLMGVEFLMSGASVAMLINILFWWFTGRIVGRGIARHVNAVVPA